MQETVLGLSPDAQWLNADLQWKLVESLVLALLLIVLRRLILLLVDRRVHDARMRYRWSKGTAYAVFFVGAFVLLQVWLDAIQSLGTFLGLVSAGLAIALKDLVADLAGWVFIMWRRPFDPGDRIQIGEHAGDVVDIRIFQFTILEIGNWVGADQSTGRIIHVPNSLVFQQALANYSAGFPYLWNELPVLVTFESDWHKAKKLLETIAQEETADLSELARETLRKTSTRFLIHYRTLTSTVYTSVQDSGVMLTIRYLCEARKRRGTAQALWERILDTFAETPDVDLAYPTQRVYLNPLEGKEKARAPLPPLSQGRPGT
jgi:small-conductance mechanosensitive channel